MKHLLFSLLLVVLAFGMVNAQMATGVAPLTITGAAVGLTIEGLEATVEGVVANTNYSVFWSPEEGASMIAPVVSGAEAASDLGFIIACDPFADVALSFILPTRLLGATTIMPINFTQMVRTEDFSNYNPNLPLVINGGADGAINLMLNYNFTVPKVIEGDGWTGSVVAIASYQ